MGYIKGPFPTHLKHIWQPMEMPPLLGHSWQPIEIYLPTGFLMYPRKNPSPDLCEQVSRQAEPSVYSLWNPA